MSSSRRSQKAAAPTATDASRCASAACDAAAFPALERVGESGPSGEIHNTDLWRLHATLPLNHHHPETSHSLVTRTLAHPSCHSPNSNYRPKVEQMTGKLFIFVDDPRHWWIPAPRTPIPAPQPRRIGAEHVAEGGDLGTVNWDATGFSPSTPCRTLRPAIRRRLTTPT